MELRGLRAAVVMYLALRNYIQGTRAAQEAYVRLASDALTEIGDALAIIEGHSGDLEAQDLTQELARYVSWRDDPRFDPVTMSSSPGGVTIEDVMEHQRQAPVLGRDIHEAMAELLHAANNIEVLARPDHHWAQNIFFRQWAYATVPRRLKHFDDLVHSLGETIRPLSTALAHLFRGEVIAAQGAASAMKKVVPLFSTALEESKDTLA
jgi:hypothetical protein